MASGSFDFDYIIIGSGFGGSVAALRLTEKGHKVLVMEKGRWFREPKDFPASNWNLKKWLWWPLLGLRGMMQLHFFSRVVVLSGVGVGGGSIVYANTLPRPGKAFFQSGSWSGLCDWEQELEPFYAVAEKMLGAVRNPNTSKSDNIMEDLAVRIGQPEKFDKPQVGIYFGSPGQTDPDPYFDGKGPVRTGCIQCGGCMLGCQHNAKNTLDKNYLYLARQLGAEIQAESEVIDVKPKNPEGSMGYDVFYKSSRNPKHKKGTYSCRGIIFAGGVMGTIPLLLKLKKSSLPNLPEAIGRGVRTNSESLIGVTALDGNTSYSEGIAIGSIVKIDQNRHIEPVVYPAGSGFWRLFMAPMVSSQTWLGRLLALGKDFFMEPIRNLKTFFVDDWSKRTLILLYMESIESTLRFKRTLFGWLATDMETGKAPTAFNPVAQKMARETEKITGGKAMVMAHESILGIPTTAHILGGACIGKSPVEGVIDKNHQVFHYHNIFICDGSAVSANPGVNPSLTITAMAERAMSRIPEKDGDTKHLI
jgi:cholesterol oxidase